MENEMRDKIADVLWESKGGFEMTCYVLANDIIAALPSMVVPLVWDELGDRWETVTCGRIQITQHGCAPSWDLSCAGNGYFDTLEAAKAAAQAHHVTTIMKAFGINA